MERLPHAIVGGAFGLFLGFLLQYFLSAAIPMGAVLFTAIVMVVLYCQFLGWLPYFANLTTFTFLLIATIPYIQAQAKFPDLALSLGIGVAFFTPIIWFALHYLPKRRAAI